MTRPIDSLVFFSVDVELISKALHSTPDATYFAIGVDVESSDFSDDIEFVLSEILRAKIHPLDFSLIRGVKTGNDRLKTSFSLVRSNSIETSIVISSLYKINVDVMCFKAETDESALNSCGILPNIFPDGLELVGDLGQICSHMDISLFFGLPDEDQSDASVILVSDNRNRIEYFLDQIRQSDIAVYGSYEQFKQGAMDKSGRMIPSCYLGSVLEEVRRYEIKP